MARKSKISNQELFTPDQNLIDKFESWVKKNKVQSDPYVTGMRSVLQTGEDIQPWAELNPLDLLPAPQTPGNARLRKISNYLTILRNVMVFFPVALTWIAVSKSTSAFATYTEQNRSAVVNFLEFWQNGYGVLGKSWTIGHVAFLDFAIILLVIALTLVVAYLHEKENSDVLKENILAENERLSLGLSLFQFLYSHRNVKVEQINPLIAQAIKNLGQTAKAMEKTSKVLNKDINSIPNNRQVIAEIKKINSRKPKKSKDAEFDFDFNLPNFEL